MVVQPKSIRGVTALVLGGANLVTILRDWGTGGLGAINDVPTFAA